MPFDPDKILNAGADARKIDMASLEARPDDFLREPTGIWKPLDYLNRLQYPVQNVLRRLSDPTTNYNFTDYLKAIGNGIVGNERSQFSDTLTNLNWNPTSTAGKITKAGIGLVGDIGLDPTTYVGGFLTKIGKAAEAGKLIKIGDAVLDVTRDTDKILDAAKVAAKSPEFASKINDGHFILLNEDQIAKQAASHIEDIKSASQGITSESKVEKIADSLTKLGIDAKPFVPAPTMLGKFDEGTRRLLNLSIPFTDKVASVTLPGERSLWKGLTAANQGIKSKEAAYVAKMATGGIPTAGEGLAAGLGAAKRALSILPEKIKQIAQGARGETALHENLLNRMIKLGGGLPTTETTPLQAEAIELLGSLEMKDLLPKDWRGIDNPEVFKSGVLDAVDKSALSNERKTRLANSVETFSDPGDIRRHLNLRDVVERGNIKSGMVNPVTSQERQAWAEAIGADTSYIPHSKPAAEVDIKALGRGGSSSSKHRTYTMGQTLYEAGEGIVDPKVKEYFLDPSRIDTVLPGITAPGGKQFTGRQIVEQMETKRPFESNLLTLAANQIKKQIPTLRDRTFTNALGKFGKPMAEAANDGHMPMARLYDPQYLGWLGRVHPTEYDSVIHTQLPTELFLASKNFLEVQHNPGAFFNALKSIGDLVKPWLLVSPGFHTRNFVSSLLMTHAGGDNILLPSTWLRAKANIKLLMNPKSTIMIKGREYTGEQLMDLYVRSTGEGSQSATAIFGDASSFSKAKTLSQKAGKVWMAAPKFSRDVGNKIETLFRFNHFVNRLVDGADPASAASSVARYFYDYAELSPSERKLQAIVPFYSWIRKNTEANLRYLVDKPAYMSAPSKAKSEIETASPKPPYPEKYLPEWLTSRGQVRMPWTGNSGEPVYSTAQGWLPQMDAPMFMKAAGGNAKDLANFALQSIHPAIQIPVEAALNKSFMTGNEIAPKGDETQTFMGVPGVPKQAVHAAGFIRPLREIDRILQLGGADYRKKGGGFTDPTRSVEALRFATGWKGYPMPEDKVLTDRWRQLGTERTNMRYLERKYEGTPKESRIKQLLDELEAEYNTLKPVVGPILNRRKIIAPASPQTKY